MLAELDQPALPSVAPPEGPSARRGRAELTQGVLLLVLATALPLLRQTGAHSWDTIWGEDGWVYFQQAHDHGLSVLLRGYAGYLQLPPRLLAVASPLVPIQLLALYFALAGALVGAALAWFVYWATEGWVDSRPVRLALASLVVLMPALGYENTANITNTIWICFGVAPWALVSLSEGRRATVLRATVAFASATATALTAIFVPLGIGYALIRRRRPTWLVLWAFAAGLVLQFAVVMNTRDTRPHTTMRQASKLPEVIGIKVFGQLLLGARGISALWDQRSALAIVAPVLVLVGLAVLLPGIPRPKQILAVAFVALALATFLVPVWGRGTNQVTLSLTAHSIFGPGEAGRYNPMATRYSVVPILLLASAAAIVFGSGRPRRRTLSFALRTGFVAWIVIVTTIGFSITNPRSFGPRWATSVVADHRAHCRHVAPTTPIKVLIPNRSVNPPVVLPCGDRP